MDVLDFINKRGKKEVPNPLFKPKAKKNIQPSSITVQDLNPDNDVAVNMAIADEINQYSIDSKTADRYRQEGINWNPWGNLDAHLVEQQGNFSKFGNALAQAVVSELAIGTVKGISDLFDLIGEGYNKNDQIEYKQQEIHQQLKQKIVVLKRLMAYRVVLVVQVILIKHILNILLVILHKRKAYQKLLMMYVH